MSAKDHGTTGFEAMQRIRELGQLLDLGPVEARRVLPGPASFMTRPCDVPAEVFARLDAVEGLIALIDQLVHTPYERHLWICGLHQLSSVAGKAPIDLLTGSMEDLDHLRRHLRLLLAQPSPGTGRAA